MAETQEPALGEWKLERKGDTQVLVTLPDGITISQDDVVIEDLLAAIANHTAIKSGRPVAKCCSGNMAIAIAPS